MSTKSNPNDDGDGLPDPEDVPSECTEFTTDVPDRIDRDDTDECYFSFVCPRCEALNPLKGYPREFRDMPFRCVECRYIPLLEAEALEDFIEEHYADDSSTEAES